MMDNIKALFTDLGGTFREVTENKPFSDAAKARIAEICKTDMDIESFYAFLEARYDIYRKWVLKYMCEPPEKYLWSRWMCPELDKAYIESYATELTYCWRKAKGERLVVPNGIETVKELRKRGYKVGIISDLVGTVEIDEWLDKDGIRDLFCSVKQSSITMLRKPHPAIYYMALDEAGLRPEECVFVGDNLKRDIIGAKETGFAGTIAVEYPGTPALKVDRENVPNCIIDSFDKLLDVLPGDGKFCPENAENAERRIKE
ncbi:MAG: HAD-IA family hydrolase [Sphaerochaetaceae bacterium]|nr:HAD-IA family hydrolase [Sphaerochaetaceae bacterium]